LRLVNEEYRRNVSSGRPDSCSCRSDPFDCRYPDRHRRTDGSADPCLDHRDACQKSDRIYLPGGNHACLHSFCRTPHIESAGKPLHLPEGDGGVTCPPHAPTAPKGQLPNAGEKPEKKDRSPAAKKCPGPSPSFSWSAEW